MISLARSAFHGSYRGMPSRFYEQSRKCGKSVKESTKRDNEPIGIPYRFVLC
jgi:hypothetical protein